MLSIFELAAKYDSNCHVHVRTSTNDASNVEEVLEYSKKSGAPLHIVHINSSGANLIPLYLETIEKAQQAGVDVTTEAYPYNRGSTFIESHLFDDWENYSDEKIGQPHLRRNRRASRPRVLRALQKAGRLADHPTCLFDGNGANGDRQPADDDRQRRHVAR